MNNKKKISFNVLGVLIALCMILALTGCQNNNSTQELQNTKNITIIVTNNESELYKETIDTDKEIVSDVLKDCDVDLQYDETDYGMYIKSLCGVNEETKEDGMYYWAFYINDEYASEGVSSTKVEDGKTYKFVYEFYKF